MSLKITVEVDGQTEQQIAPVVAPFVARLAMRHPEWTQVDKQGRSPGQVQVRDFHHDNSALLQQHIQQLTAQNKLLQQQVSQKSAPTRRGRSTQGPAAGGNGSAGGDRFNSCHLWSQRRTEPSPYVACSVSRRSQRHGLASDSGDRLEERRCDFGDRSSG